MAEDELIKQLNELITWAVEHNFHEFAAEIAKGTKYVKYVVDERKAVVK